MMKNITMRCEIKKIYHRGQDDFTIASVKIKKHPTDVPIPTADTIIRGYFRSIHEQDDVDVVGNWVDYKKYGYQFCVKEYSLISPETKKGMVKFLTNHINALGTTLAKRIVDTFGLNTMEIIRKQPELIKGIEGMTEKKYEKIKREISQLFYFDEVLYYTIKNGLSYHNALAICEKYGGNAINKIKNNPYSIRNIDNITFLQCEKIAKNEGVAYNAQIRVKEGILYYIESNVEYGGNVFVHKKNVISGLNHFLKGFRVYSEEINKFEITKAINELIKEKQIVEHTYNDNKYLYLSSYFHMENYIVHKLKDMLFDVTEKIDEKVILNKIAEYEKLSNIDLDKKQSYAIKMALSNKISILTGGPGTGKTQTIKAIIEVAKMINPNISIALSAPTGRASKRMTELTNLPASTIHRLIHLSPTNKEEIEPILADFIIIDESSMIDIGLFYYLLQSIQDGSRILFVGDYNQLPSVGAGLILRDLIDSKTIPTTVLTEIFRQNKNSNIVINAHKIIQASSQHTNSSMPIGGKKIAFKEGNDFIFHTIREKLLIKKQIINQIESLIKDGHKLDDIQVITAIKAGDLGVDELNRLIQKQFNKQSEVFEFGDKKFMVGDRVIQTKNNYDLKVFNGEIGKVVGIDEEEGIVEVDFDGNTVVFNRDVLGDLNLAYAITIHKSQGSEFPIVIIPIHFSMSYNYYKNSIYTAITRARKCVYIIGDKKLFEESCLKEETHTRNSLIKPKLEDLFVSQLAQ